MRVQWTRLPHGVPSPEFVMQVKRLMESPRAQSPAQSPSASARSSTGAFPPAKRGVPAWAWGALAAVAVGIAAALYLGRKPEAVAPPKAAPEPAAVPTPVPTGPEVSSKSIAVLPFANFSTDKDNEFFADGLQDEVITALAKIHDLKVISRTSTMTYKNPEGRNLKKIAAELGVATILEGSVQRMGSKVHLNVQLIDARTDQHLWADSYTEDLTDVFAMESSLAGEVVGALKASFTTDEKALLARRPTQDVEAFDLYLQGRALYERISITSSVEFFDRIADIFDQAAARDPSFLLPHVAAANLHGEAYWFGSIDPTAARMAKAKAELDAAIRIAPDAPETHVARGSFEYTCNNDWRRALEELQKAEAALPNDADLHFRIGLAYRRLGRVPEGLAEIERSAELSPNDEFVAATTVETIFSLKRYARALEVSDRLLSIHPDSILIQNLRVRSRFELDGDRAAYLRDYVALETGPAGTKHSMGAYYTAMETGDLAAAERALANPKLTSITNEDGSINDPVSLHRSLVAYLQGHLADARRYSDEAITAYKTQTWTPRQGVWVKLGIARAEAYAGRMDEALRDGGAAADEAMAKDGYTGPVVLSDFGQIQVLAGRTEEAFVTLRKIVTPVVPVASPNDIRYDQIWSRLKGDPRFEQTLKSAKPL